MSQQKDIILHNDDKTTIEYVLLILNKVFDLSRKDAYELAKEVDSTGSAVIFTGSEEEVEEKIAKVQMYNSASSNNLRMTSQDHGLHQDPRHTERTTTGTSLTMKLSRFSPAHEEIVDYIQIANSVGNLDLSINQGYAMARDLSSGMEVVLKDFGADPQEQTRAELLKELIESSLELHYSEEYENTSNVVFSVRPANHTLAGPSKLPSEEDVENIAFLDVIGSFGDMVGEAYNKSLIEKYGSVEEFLAKAPQSEIDDYNEIKSQLGELDDIIDSKKKFKP